MAHDSLTHMVVGQNPTKLAKSLEVAGFKEKKYLLAASKLVKTHCLICLVLWDLKGCFLVLLFSFAGDFECNWLSHKTS